MSLPPCGLYRTLAPIGSIPTGRLVFFHNHGDPGPGVYLPSGWKANRVQVSPQGTTLSSPELTQHLQALPAEGFYRVTEGFHCCERKCRRFEPEMLVQLGYNAEAQAILFVPELVEGMLAIPQSGASIDPAGFDKLKPLKVAMASSGGNAAHPPVPGSGAVH
jgi:hypothetical protein